TAVTRAPHSSRLTVTDSRMSDSSSTRSTWRPWSDRGLGPGRRASPLSHAASPASTSFAGTGSRTVKVAPWPSPGLAAVTVPPAARRELDGVGDEVPDDLLQPVAIAAHRPDAVVELALEGDLLRIGRRTDRVDGALDGCRQVDGRQLETQLAGDDARDLEEVLD